MSSAANFTAELEARVAQQIKSQRVGYLLGAGSSHLDGKGYPLASELWDKIKGRITSSKERAEIQSKLDEGADGIEQALDLLDLGGPQEGPHRHSVTLAIADLFKEIAPSLDTHVSFIKRLGQGPDPCVKIFSLNYDPLLERAAERGRVRLIDGFLGHEHAYFNPAVFSETPLQSRGPRAKPSLHPAGVPVHLYKLHGSIGWYESSEYGVCRCGFGESLPTGVTRLMVPPQRRKGSEVTRAPYSPLWTAFHGAMSLDHKPLMRLISVGYGFRDEHVNDAIDSALARPDFRLLIFAKDLSDTAWSRWSTKRNAIVVTEQRCAIEGVEGSGHAHLWQFERLAQEV